MDKMDSIKEYFCEESVIKVISAAVLFIVGITVMFISILTYGSVVEAFTFLLFMLGLLAGIFGLVPLVMAWYKWQDIM